MGLSLNLCQSTQSTNLILSVQMVISSDEKMMRTNSEGAQRELKDVTPTLIEISKMHNNTVLNLKKMPS